jgi:lipopolysaccharide export system protein LptA
VADDRITIDAQTIAIGLEGRQMSAKGTVKSTLRPRPPAAIAAADEGETGRIPGLLKQDQPANVNAATLEYAGAAGKATYTGDAALWQGETSVRADTIVIDQQSGDLIATGSARATIALETGNSIGRAHEIRYEDARHALVYAPPPPAPVPTGTSGGRGTTALPTAPAPQPQLSGPQGDLRADLVEVFLAAGGGKLERLEASANVTMQIDPGTPTRRTATGGHLTYRAATEQYDMVGTAASPVKVVESCREITGKTLTFYKSTDRISVDGNEEIRTETKSGGPCPQSAPPRPTQSPPPPPPRP